MLNLFCGVGRGQGVVLVVKASWGGMASDGELFNDTFVIEAVDRNADGATEKKFDKVSRIEAKSENYETTLTLDVNMELYPLQRQERVRLMLASKLSETGDSEGYNPTAPLPSRADAFGYIMYGKIFKYAENAGKAVVYASFGGLLMALTGEPRTLSARSFNVDSSLYLFMTKTDEN